MNIENLPPLRDVIAQHNLGAKKSLGQNFLLDLNLTDKIARTAGDLSGHIIFEIGPGPGGLTRALLKTNALKIIAIERDERCVTALQDLVKAAEGRLEIVSADALKIDLSTLTQQPYAVIANLPYNISTVLLLKWLEHIDACTSLTLMFQKEVAQRLIAKPRTEHYGRLSIITQWLCDVQIAFDIPSRAFTPSPKVTSSVVHLKPKTLTNPQPSFKAMETVTAAAFGQRRKMLRSSLKTLGIDVHKLIANTSAQETQRAEELPLEAFVQLALNWQELAG